MSDLQPVDDIVELLPPVDNEATLAHRAGALDAVNMVRSALLALDDLRLANPDDHDGLARLFQLCRIFEKDLAALRRATEENLFTAMPDKTMDVDGVGRIERKQGRSRKVDDHQAVDEAIADRSRWDDAGERFDEVDEYVTAAISMTRKVYGANRPGITKCEKLLGLDGDEISEWVDGRPTVVMPPTPT